LEAVAGIQQGREVRPGILQVAEFAVQIARDRPAEGRGLVAWKSDQAARSACAGERFTQQLGLRSFTRSVNSFDRDEQRLHTFLRCGAWLPKGVGSRFRSATRGSAVTPSPGSPTGNDSRPLRWC